MRRQMEVLNSTLHRSPVAAKDDQRIARIQMDLLEVLKREPTAEEIAIKVRCLATFSSLCDTTIVNCLLPSTRSQEYLQNVLCSWRSLFAGLAIGARLDVTGATTRICACFQIICSAYWHICILTANYFAAGEALGQGC